MSTTLQALVHWYESLTPASLRGMEHFYHPDVYFKDPFHEITCLDALRAVYERMFQHLDSPRFTVLEQIRQDEQAVIIWQFRFGYRGTPHVIRGSSHLRFDGRGRVVHHRDYWDAAEELYETIPVLGAVLRLVKRKIG